MLPIRCEKLYTPPSSPPSPSSSTWPNSSSPPSPSQEPLSLDDDDEDERDFCPTARVADPLAGSYMANRGKRMSTASSPPCTPSKKKARLNLPELVDELAANEIQEPSVVSLEAAEALEWEMALETAFKSGVRKIDLSGCNITRIPPRVILDLAKLVVLAETGETFDDMRLIKPPSTSTKRTFTRIQTAPATTSRLDLFGPIAAPPKTLSSREVLNGTSREHVDLYLANNSITKLPTELWCLRDLRILSLRNNGIRYLPPEIAKLENLVDLNVALNKLTFLPSELTTMKKLTKLIVLPNPCFLPDPQTGAMVSETRNILSCVPPLTELALRVWFTRPKEPFPSSSTPETVLEDVHVFPLQTSLPPPLRRTLAICVPGSIAKDGTLPTKPDNQEILDEVTGIGHCPNPAHGITESVFAQHVEERYTWVNSVSGIKLGGIVPLRWRGCERGCLAFLDPPIQKEESKVGSAKSTNGGAGEEEVVVQTLQFAAAELDFDD